MLLVKTVLKVQKTTNKAICQKRVIFVSIQGREQQRQSLAEAAGET